MKTILKFGIYILSLVFAAICEAQTATVPAPTAYQVVRRDGNSDILQQTFYKASPAGTTVPHARSVTRIATGLNYWTVQDGARAIQHFE